MNAEDAIVAHLAASLPVAVFREVPRDRPDSFVTVERTGGALNELVRDSALLAVQAWAATPKAARELAYQCRDALTCAVERDSVFSVSVTSLYNDADTDSGSPRYQLVCTVENQE